MFLAGIFLGAMIGAIITFITYACIIVGKESDENLTKDEKCKQE